MKKDLNYYISIDYPVTISYDPEYGYYAKIELLDHCSAVGDTPDEAYANVIESKKLWLETALEEGLDIPEPKAVEEYSGRFVLRLPKSLHAKVVKAAEDEGTSLNQYLVMLISAGYEVNNISKMINSLKNEIALNLRESYFIFQDMLKKFIFKAREEVAEIEEDTEELPEAA